MLGCDPSAPGNVDALAAAGRFLAAAVLARVVTGALFVGFACVRGAAPGGAFPVRLKRFPGAASPFPSRAVTACPSISPPATGVDSPVVRLGRFPIAAAGRGGPRLPHPPPP